jgi:hypothetical protein
VAQLIKEFGKPVASLDFPKKTVSVKGTSIGKKSKGAEEERRALFNTWLNGVLLMPDVLEFQEMKVWLGLEKATKVSQRPSCPQCHPYDKNAHRRLTCCCSLHTHRAPNSRHLRTTTISIEHLAVTRVRKRPRRKRWKD